jgi:Tol biopolymer transport system component
MTMSFIPRPAALLRFAAPSCLLMASASAQVSNERVSLSYAGAEGNAASYGSAISADGRYVAFISDATNLVAGDSNGARDVFLRDRVAGTTIRVNLTSAGGQATLGAALPNVTVDGNNLGISGDGRFVVFLTADALVASDVNGITDAYLRDTQSNTTVRVSTAGTPSLVYTPMPTLAVAISSDGVFVAFSTASTLVASDTDNLLDIYVRDTSTATTTMVSLTNASLETTTGNCYHPSISADGQYVAFASTATDLVGNDINGSTADVYVRNRNAPTTTLVSVNEAGNQWLFPSEFPDISGSGRRVSYIHYDLIYGLNDIFVADQNSDNVLPWLQNGDLRSYALTAGPTPLGSYGGCSQNSAISADGNFVAFTCSAALVTPDTNGVSDTFICDLTNVSSSIPTSGIITYRLSQTLQLAEADAASSNLVDLSASGQAVAYTSLATNLVTGDSNSADDVFVHRFAQYYDSFCFGDGSGMDCPCMNNGAPGHGCENSGGAGGGLVVGGGNCLLSVDTFTLNASNLTGSTAVLLQGSASHEYYVYEDGLRCVAGTLLRIGTSTVSAGSCQYPNVGDPSISARSAVLGHAITAGQTLHYQVQYRDPNPTFCMPLDTSNMTNAVTAIWAP